jgi:hypothetical protein
MVSPFDGESVLVQSVIPNSGQIILLESEVDAMVSNSGVRDNGGNPLTAVVDVDGLTLPNAPGYFFSQHTPGQIHHLWFSGYSMTGAGILSTEGGGTIPFLNGVAMASNGSPTTGVQVGLVPPNVRSLAGLALTPDALYHFVTDSPTPNPSGAGTIKVQIGGCPPAPNAFLLWNLGQVISGGVDVGIDVGALNFREWYPHVVMNLVGIGPDRCGEWNFMITDGIFNNLKGRNLRFQAHVGGGALWLSTPCKIQF